ncbi:helix-turn-helix domain-containing protein [Ideonella sp. BN130291]|uniref:helix-turn-helix domain-containing protein n=1 Tax=Ideonella sp. BN130291 TaxID=3112940 RepID=UPI002E275804|nr:AraC family transcriptional regulator [Ideonella sp. BN130291]
MAYLAQTPQPALAAVNRAPVQLWLPRASLSHCVRAMVFRSTLGIGRDWPEAWRYNHFPASPLCAIGWFFQGHSELIDEGHPAAPESPGQRVPQVYFSGPVTRPTISRNSPEGHGMMLMLLPDAVQAMTGLNPAEWINRFAPLSAALDADWQHLGAAVLAAPDDPSRVALIEEFLLPRWQAARPAASAPGTPRLRDWAQGLSMRAASSGVGRSLRQAERRIKGWTGLPMRELRGIGRAEQAFFHTLAQGDAPVRWAEVAADAGYADQSHLCRETRRVTGFAPAELRQRIAEDEAFWIYRVWI